MAHRADEKAFSGKGYTHHVVFNSCAVAGFVDEPSAKADAEDRNNRASKLGSTQGYSVKPASEAEFIKA